MQARAVTRKSTRTCPWEFNSVSRLQRSRLAHRVDRRRQPRGVAVTAPGEVLGKVSGMAPRARIAGLQGLLWSHAGHGERPGGTGGRPHRGDRHRESPTASMSSITRSAARQTNFAGRRRNRFPVRRRCGCVRSHLRRQQSARQTSRSRTPSPWVTTVAAGTHNRPGAGLGSATLGDGRTFNWVPRWRIPAGVLRR